MGQATRILMIEDDERLAAMVAEYLGGHGLELRIEGTIAAGREALRAERFDGLILDAMLPDGDGFDLCRELRGESEIPLVMLTARGEEIDRIIGLELGADDYLPKPFNPRELLARLRAVLRRGGAGRGRDELLRIGALEIDPVAREVRVDGEVRALTALQFDLLHRLAKSPGRVLSREQLMQETRGSDVGPFDRAIDVHVSRIRAAIEADPKQPKRLITVRGVGYVLATEFGERGD